MGDKFNDIGIKSCTKYFFDDMINIKNLDQNKIKIDEKSNKNILIYYIGYVWLLICSKNLFLYSVKIYLYTMKNIWYLRKYICIQ